MSAFAAPQPRRSADRQFLPVAPGSLTEAPTARTMLRRSRGALALGAVLAALATWYGFLEAAGGHPSLKLGGAMALAGAGVAALLVARPIGQSPGHAHEHSALVAAHPVALGLAWLSLGAALVHFAVIQEHFAEFWAYGVFFIVVATSQLGWAILMVVRPIRPLLVAGAIGNAAVIAAWVVTRTYGALVGPEASEPAEAGFGDIVNTVFEALIVLGAVLLLRRWRVHRPEAAAEAAAAEAAAAEAGAAEAGAAEAGAGPNPHWGEVAKALAAIGITLLAVLALYSTVGGSPFVSHIG